MNTLPSAAALSQLSRPDWWALWSAQDEPLPEVVVAQLVKRISESPDIAQDLLLLTPQVMARVVDALMPMRGRMDQTGMDVVLFHAHNKNNLTAVQEMIGAWAQTRTETDASNDSNFVRQMCWSLGWTYIFQSAMAFHTDKLQGTLDMLWGIMDATEQDGERSGTLQEKLKIGAVTDLLKRPQALPWLELNMEKWSELDVTDVQGAAWAEGLMKNAGADNFLTVVRKVFEKTPPAGLLSGVAIAGRKNDPSIMMAILDAIDLPQAGSGMVEQTLSAAVDTGRPAWVADVLGRGIDVNKGEHLGLALSRALWASARSVEADVMSNMIAAQADIQTIVAACERITATKQNLNNMDLMSGPRLTQLMSERPDDEMLVLAEKCPSMIQASQGLQALVLRIELRAHVGGGAASRPLKM